MDSLSFEASASPHRPGWMEFCDKHARTAAEEFFASFLVFLKAHPTSEFRPREPIDYARKFVEFFLDHFEYKANKNAHSHLEDTFQKEPVDGAGLFTRHDRQQSGDSRGSPGLNGYDGPGSRSVHEDEDLFHDNSSVNGGFSHDRGRERLDSATESHNSSNMTSPSLKSKGSILKRFSFRKIKQRGIFKQSSEEVELASGSSENYLRERHLSEQKHSKRNKKLHKESKQKLSPNLPHSAGEVKKEGIVYVLTGEDSKGKSKWEKTRLVLLKTDSSYLLEFYSPPKVWRHLLVNVVSLSFYFSAHL